MKRVTISVSDEFAKQLTAFTNFNRYENRSEALRDLMRVGLQKARIDAGGDSGCYVATLSYVFDHSMSHLSARLSGAHHAHRDLVIANMRVPLDHQLCLDVVVLRGDVGIVRGFAQRIIVERGVTHGKVNFAPANVDDDGGGQGARPRLLARSSPKAKRAK